MAKYGKKIEKQKNWTPTEDLDAGQVPTTTVSEETEEAAEDLGGWVEGDLSIGNEFYWTKRGKSYRYYVDDETTGIRIEHSQEFLGGNRHWVSRWRGRVLVDTNDGRQSKQIEKDPGAQIWAKGPDGITKVVSVPEFLTLINKNNAKMRNVYGQR